MTRLKFLTNCWALCCYFYLPKTLSQIKFPEKFELPHPAECLNQESFCGDDPENYPVEQINKIVIDSIELQIAPETTTRFFGAHLHTNETRLSDPYSETIKPTCEIREELIPRFARAKNVFGRWVYLVEASNHLRQHVKIVLCSDPDRSCKNDGDSPYGDGTTVCKQLYKTQKLLAIDKNGEMVVDTFKLPSACVCNYKGRFGLGFRGGFDIPTSKQPPKCTSDNATQILEDVNVPTMMQKGVLPLQLSKSNLEVKPCNAEAIMCESDDDDASYPSTLIQTMLETHVAFKSPSFFGTIFGDICEPVDANNVIVRGVFDLELTQLCTSYEKYIYPKKAKNSDGEWHYIINTDQYRQGVTIQICLPRVKDSSCLYGGAEGLNPSGTVCKQLFSLHHMLAIKTNGSVSYEAFPIPSSCSCFNTQDSVDFDS